MNAYIVEDDDDMRFILKRSLKKNFPSFTHIYESATAEVALNEICELKPELALIDISLPGMDGIELIKRIRPCCKTICILVVTGHELDLYRKSALETGADNIISKANSDELIKIIRELLQKDNHCGCN